MDDPTPRPPVGTDLAPCPDCGADLDPRVGEDSDGQWWDIDCAGTVDRDGCGWCAYEVEALDAFTLAGAPWTRALWAEVERLRLELAELRLTLAAEQGQQEGAPSEGWEYDGRSWRRYGRALGHSWVERGRSATSWITQSGTEGTAPNMRGAMQAADAAEAAAGALAPNE